MRLLAAATLLCVYGGSAWGEYEGGQMCYVCRKDAEPFLDDSDPLASQFPHEGLPVCGKDRPAKKLCPPGYQKGCYTETKGEKVLTKMCSGVDIADCQEANDVNYCYCRGPLCNNEEEVPPRGMTSSTTPETDDEDLSGEGGSGDGSTTARQLPTTTARPGHAEPSNHAAAAGLTSSLILLPLALRL